MFLVIVSIVADKVRVERTGNFWRERSSDSFVVVEDILYTKYNFSTMCVTLILAKKVFVFNLEKLSAQRRCGVGAERRKGKHEAYQQTANGRAHDCKVSERERQETPGLGLVHHA